TSPDTAKAFETLKEALHAMTFPVEHAVVASLVTAVRAGRDDNLAVTFAQGVHERVCVVPSVAEDRRAGRAFQKHLCHGHFVDLALGDGERDRPTTRLDAG